MRPVFRRPAMPVDLDTFLVALSTIVDERYQQHVAPRKPVRRGRRAMMSDSEVQTPHAGGTARRRGRDADGTTSILARERAREPSRTGSGPPILTVRVRIACQRVAFWRVGL